MAMFFAHIGYSEHIGYLAYIGYSLELNHGP